MTEPEVVRCPDGHFRRAVYGLGPYIADYPEQALLACIVQNWCAKYVSETSFVTCQLTCLSRCTAPADDLDGGIYGRCSREHTDVLVETFELGVLWDEYGLVGDVVVCIISHVLSAFPSPPVISTIGLSAYTRDRSMHFARLRTT
jgi:hypothetical protein